MKIQSNIKIADTQPWRDGLYLIVINQQEKVEDSDTIYEGDMVISQSNSEDDIELAINQFNENNNCFDNIINGVH